MLRPMRTEWNMHFAEGGEQALEIIAREKIDVVVTDMRMPGMDGVGLLKKVLEHDPGIARIILSGQSDEEAALRSSGIAHRFLAKPCDADSLRDSVRRTCQLRELLKNDDVQRIVAGLESLPSLPEIFQELKTEMESEDMSLERISRIVARDIALSAKILQIVNSAFFGLPRHVGDVSQAITYLGAETIRSLALSTAAFRCFDGDSKRLNLDDLQSHCLAVGSVARAIAMHETNDKVVADDALQAGMLHDIGKLIMVAAVPDLFEELCNKVKRENIPVRNAEEMIMGCDHAQMGAYLIGLWGLPDSIVEAIAFHHSRDQVMREEFTPLAAVYAANQLVHDYHRNVGAAESSLSEFSPIRSNPGKLVDWLHITAQTMGQEKAA